MGCKAPCLLQGAAGLHLDVAVDDEVLMAAQLIPQHVKLRAHSHGVADALQPGRAAERLPCMAVPLAEQA